MPVGSSRQRSPNSVLAGAVGSDIATAEVLHFGSRHIHAVTGDKFHDSLVIGHDGNRIDIIKRPNLLQ